MFSAMGWAGDSVLVRLGVRRSNIFAAMLMSYLVSVTCIWTYLVATTPLVFLSSPAMVYFLISGCLQPLFARALFYEGITRIGVARAGPLRGAEPLFATIIAVVLLHERPGIMVYLGTALIMGSLWLISGSRGGAAKWRLVDAALPLGAGLVSAISQTLRKEGLKILTNSFVETAIVNSTSFEMIINDIICITADIVIYLFVNLFNETALVDIFYESRVRKFFNFVLPDVRASVRDVFEANFHSR